MKIIEVKESREKAQLVTQILADLPEWFGLPESTAAYVEMAKNLTCFACEVAGVRVGFVTVEHPFAKSAEINAMGILKKYHRQGIGQALIQTVKRWSEQEGIEFLQVKTLAETHPDPYYQKTRVFYQQMGFTPLEVFPLLWGEANPCLQLILAIQSEETR